jgi:predicted FMN-binding regulatory protein PaiB
MTDREAIARIIDPNSFPFEVCPTWDYERVKRQNSALTKADAILNLLSRTEKTDEQEIANPRCGCPTETVRRVIVEHGVCGMGGCPYGGDI